MPRPKSCQEISDLLRDNELRIVLGLNTHQNLSEIVPLLAGQCVSMFQVLRVEKGCWWLPVIRNGEDCRGTSAFNPKEFTWVFAEIVMGSHIKAGQENPMRFRLDKSRYCRSGETFERLVTLIH